MTEPKYTDAQTVDVEADAKKYRMLLKMATAKSAYDLYEGTMWSINGIHDPKSAGLDAVLSQAIGDKT